LNCRLEPENFAVCGSPSVTYSCDHEASQCNPKTAGGGRYPTKAGCVAACQPSYNCENKGQGDQCIAVQGTTGKYPNKAACDVQCKAPPAPTPIPPCNSTNYREFWCTTANDTESFSSLATKLHVNPFKLGDNNFLYDHGKGLKSGDSLRVPFDQCLPKVGAWNCYTVKAGDTLESVATGSESLVQNVDTLKSYNLEILYGDDTLYPGQQLRLPIHICFEDEPSDCHIVKAKETLESIAEIYNTTSDELCSSNTEILLQIGFESCKHGYAYGAIVVGMELAVPTLRPA
jgi:hypothetical protein